MVKNVLGPMAYEITKTIKGHQYRYEVESYRENGKVKQRILKNLGRADKVEQTRSIFLKTGKVDPNGMVSCARGMKDEVVGIVLTIDQAQGFLEKLKSKQKINTDERKYLEVLTKQLAAPTPR